MLAAPLVPGDRHPAAGLPLLLLLRHRHLATVGGRGLAAAQTGLSAGLLSPQEEGALEVPQGRVQKFLLNRLVE